jgi:carbonic anhydrase
MAAHGHRDPSEPCLGCRPQLDRRRLLGLAGLGLAGTALPVGRVFAAGGTDALLLNCMDYRLTAATTNYMTAQRMAGKYDQVVIAGASLGARNTKFPDWGKTFWDHVQVALDLHHIHKIVILDHRDCGAYKVILGEDLAKDPKKELEVHATTMRALRSDINAKFPKLEIELLLMALNGRVEKVT